MPKLRSESQRATMPPPPHLVPYARTIVVGNLRLHCYIAGAEHAPPLVLIHGLGDDADTWRHVFLPLAEYARVIALDLPGFGRSDRPYRPYTLAFFAGIIEALLDGLGIRSATLVGSSLGAAVAQRVALNDPSPVAQLVLIGGALPVKAIPPPVQFWRFLLPIWGELTYTQLRRSQEAAYATLRPYYFDFAALTPADHAFLRERVWARVWSAGQRRAYLSALRWYCLERVTRANVFRQRLVNLTVPTQLIWGEHDMIAPRVFGETVVELLAEAQLHIIPASGHLPHQEQPAAVIERVQPALAPRQDPN